MKTKTNHIKYVGIDITKNTIEDTALSQDLGEKVHSYNLYKRRLHIEKNVRDINIKYLAICIINRRISNAINDNFSMFKDIFKFLNLTLFPSRSDIGWTIASLISRAGNVLCNPVSFHSDLADRIATGVYTKVLPQNFIRRSSVWTVCIRLLILAVVSLPSPLLAQQKPGTKPPSAAVPSSPAREPVPAVTAPVAVDPKKSNAPAWTVGCASRVRGGAADCSMEQRLFDQASGRLLSVALFNVPGSTRQPMLVLQLPIGLSLPDGVSLTIDELPARPVAFQSCDARGCLASIPVTPEFLAALKQGKAMTVRAVSVSRDVMIFPHSLSDFSVSFDAIQ